MACYLTFSEIDRECEGCGYQLSRGVVGLTDELDGRLVPQCKSCLFALDRRMAATWITSIAALKPDAFDKVIESLLEMPEFADLAEPPKRPN